MIEFRAFSYRYPDSPKWALDSLDLRIPKGQFCALLGANGAGKSSFCYAISGFVPHFFRGEWQGKVFVDGVEIAKATLGELAAEIGIVFQNPFNQISGARFTVREEIAFGLENLGLNRAEMQTRVESVLQIVGLEDLAERSPFALSGGQQQRVTLAAMLAMRPKVLVLDEPTSQLDPHGTQDVFAALDALTKEAETTIVLVEHKVEWVAAFADRVLLLDEGKVVADGAGQDVLTSLELEACAVESTRFTQAARSAREAALVRKDGPLPVSLSQARSFFA